jgi:hypothetical protein
MLKVADKTMYTMAQRGDLAERPRASAAGNVRSEGSSDSRVPEAGQPTCGCSCRHLGGVHPEATDLSRNDGSPDYLAMREALTNLFIHQDYADQRSCARIAIRPNETEFFNAGYSLTAVDRLEEGGAHQARNPLVARALRLMGFAEIAGSGGRPPAVRGSALTGLPSAIAPSFNLPRPASELC